ncbi:GSCFA domain-containing protein [Algibacter mikhailovii]|uniref:GSCFA domain-containing protein n=1 Tax=Algibacter mikhailovii TaxID=425498 RepID=A0A918RBT8_9FLAO|nr:GSCFA domain-containing protein [Algibacter mikhailovii]GGZ91580.1 hypothetical protein GCM10007028_32440 [Algibacter mikhailovii]
MELQTKIPLEKQLEHQIDYTSNVLLIGSCFSDNIGAKLDYYKFQNVQNPFGVLFHPKAIETLIHSAVSGRTYLEKDVIFHNEQWHCFDAHSKLSNASKEDLLIQLNRQVQITHQQLKTSSHVIITLGTAWAYVFKVFNQHVANCHKIPQKQFDKVLLSVEDIVMVLNNIIDLIQKANPHAAIIFTVSPVRHLKDGFVENTQSKSHLIAAIHGLLNANKLTASQSLFYFPSYELLMDELRDYRFYNDDMIHPNALAINYIWEKFKWVWCSDTSTNTLKKVETIQKGLKHKPFNANSLANKKFLKHLNTQIQELQIQYPHIVF